VLSSLDPDEFDRCFVAWMAAVSKGMVLVESERTVDGTSSTEQRDYMSNHGDLDAEQLGARIQAHWSIENSLHWVLEVVCDEDRCRLRQGHFLPARPAHPSRVTLALLAPAVTWHTG